MILCTLLAISYTPWEEKLLAAAFLSGQLKVARLLQRSDQAKINLGLKQLCYLPTEWANELCWDVLLTATKNEESARTNPRVAGRTDCCRGGLVDV